MAQQQPAPAQQRPQQPNGQQQARPPQAVPSSTEQLQAMLNAVLMAIGSVLNDPSKRKDGSAQGQLRVIPHASGRFHELLDKLESELTQAKVVMRRDLAVLREKENMAKVEKEDATKIKTDAVAGLGQQNGNSAGGDVQMTDAGDAQSSAVVETIEGTTTSVADMSTTAAPTTIIPDDPSLNLDAAATAADDPLDGTDIDFDALFNDPSGPADQADPLNPVADGDLGLSFTDGDADAGAGDPTQLLAGLESYANIAEDGVASGAPSGGDGIPGQSGDGMDVDANGLPDLDFSAMDVPAQNANAEGAAAEVTVSLTAADAITNTTQDVDLDAIFNMGETGDGAGGGDGNGGELTGGTFDEIFGDLGGDYGVDAQGGGGEGGDGADDWEWFNQ